MKRRLQRIITVPILCLCMMLTGMPVYAAKSTSKTSSKSSASDVAAEQKALEELQNKVAATQQAIDNLTTQKQQNEQNREKLVSEQEDLQAKYNAIKAQADAVNTQMATAQKNIDSLNDTMDSLSMELDGLETEEEQRYADMKKRIQYFYENQYGKSALTIFIESDSVHDAMDSILSVSRIMEYDRNCLDEIQKTQEEIKAKQKDIEARQADIIAFQQSINTSVTQLNALKDAAGDELSDKNGELSAVNANAADYDQQIAIYQKQKNSMEAQAAQAQSSLAKKVAVQMAQATTTEYTGGAIGTGDDEVMLLAATIQGEAWNQPYEGKLAVGSVIANRVKSKYFPNTITGVITAPRQFSAYSCGLVNKYLQAGVDPTCLEIAKKVVAGTRNGNWLFFMTKPWADYFGITGYQLIGAHAFFRVWGNNTGQNYAANTDDTPIAVSTTTTTADGTQTTTVATDSGSTTTTTTTDTGTTAADAGNTTQPTTPTTDNGSTTSTPATTPADSTGTGGNQIQTSSSDGSTTGDGSDSSDTGAGADTTPAAGTSTTSDTGTN